MKIVDNLKKRLYFLRCELLFSEGLRNGSIVPFEEDLYKRLNKVYFNGYPLSIQIRYLRPLVSPGQCEDRSWFITMGFEDAFWVSGDIKTLELNYGKKSAWHFWVEHDDWVYDPTLLYKIRKELYYKMYIPKNVIVRRPEQYKKDEWYQEVINTTVDDLKPGGKDRCHLCVSIPLVQNIARMSGSQEFVDELDEHLRLIKYDHKQVVDELNTSIRNFTKKRT